MSSTRQGCVSTGLVLVKDV